MTKKENSAEVLSRLNKQVRLANHGLGYYFSLFLLLFAIPLYILLQFFYTAAGGWELFDIVFVIILLAIAVDMLYRDVSSKAKLPIWLTVLAIISGIIVALVQYVL